MFQILCKGVLFRPADSESEVQIPKFKIATPILRLKLRSFFDYHKTLWVCRVSDLKFEFKIQ